MKRTLTAAIVALALPSIALAKPSSDKEWILHQTSPNQGKNDIYVSRQAVKLSSPFGFEIIARAPDWKVHALSAQKQLEWVDDMSTFDGKMMLRPLGVGTWNIDKVVDEGVEFKAGIKCHKMVTRPQPIEQIWRAADIEVAPKGAELVQRFYSCPDIGGVPIYRTKFFAGIKKRKREAWIVDYTHPKKPTLKVTLNTLSYRELPFNPQDFKIPSGYKRTKVMTDITFSNEKMSDLTDALDNIGFQADPRKKK